MGRVTRHCGSDAGSTAAEYALIAGLIAMVVVTAVVFLGGSVLDLFDSSASSVSSATNG